MDLGRPDGNNGAATSLRESDLTSDRQRSRRARIILAATDIAQASGYDGVLMRDVARTAGVALGTMYRYFPSKAHLLVAVLAAQLGRFELHACRSLDDIDDPYDRLRRVISMLTAEMQRAPLMTDALARGFAQASFAAGTDMDEVRDQLSEMFASLMSAYRPSSRHRDIGDLLADVWATDILGLALGTNSLDAVSFRFSRLLDLLRRNEMVPRGDEQRDV